VITIPAREFTNLAMINGNEKTYSIIVHNGVVKEWVGFGWIVLHPATPEDLAKYPTVGESK